MSSPLTYTRVAIVTGAGQGIGRAIALRLAADGLDIAVVGLSSGLHRLEDLADEIKKMDRKSIVIACDVSKEDEVKSMVDQTVAELGRLDAVIIWYYDVGSNLIQCIDGRKCRNLPTYCRVNDRWSALTFRVIR